MRSIKFNLKLMVATCGVIFGLSNFASGQQSLKSYTSYVDPYIGSGGHGHVFVGASVPFGAVQLGPENFYKGWDWCSGYNYGDSVLIGFSHTHLSGTGIGDLSDVLLMPYTGSIKTDKGLETVPGSGYAAHYRHRNEKARPGYYAVKLDDSNIDVELTATERVGFHRYRFPKGKEAHVIIDLKEGINDSSTETFVRQLSATTLVGYRFSKGWAKNQMLFFALVSSEPWSKLEVFDDKQKLDGTAGKGRFIKGLLSFDKAPADLRLKVGISPVSSENALANIKAEIPGWDFEGIVKTAEQKWNHELGKVEVTLQTTAQQKVFYTALYHTMIDPALFNDHNGDYRGADKKIYHAEHDVYTAFSTWDTYRAENPLLVLTQPKRTADMVNTLVDIANQQGRLPLWHLMANETGTMVGIASRQIIAEAYLKGIKGFDADKAYQALQVTSRMDTLGMAYVKNFRAIPVEKESRSVAKAMEYAIGDGSIALMAKGMGKMDDYLYYKQRSENYHLYYDPTDGFFKGKMADGSWIKDFNPLASKNNPYAEGNAWQYLWLAPQDIPGLIRQQGGEQRFTRRLDEFFQLKSGEEGPLADLTGLIGQYAHGNEPSHHIAYLYNYVGQQWKTAEKVRFIMETMYKDSPDGIIGNEDCGQMSAWYVFSAMGLYPVYPASLRYAIGSPLIKKATLHLSEKDFTITARNNKPGNIFIKNILFNGKPYSKSYLTHADLMKGGHLQIIMDSHPNKKFGSAKTSRP
ncbi:GH92 family glycosyl hydrolase [Mucilaginibacter sabulilitoris]|uniref:GH92 family glycosyl hydrolase n=1 Tax=Mucilaginibacter sabulilitoris TaxID=1173583 RepID=A0ABZ0TUC2_9SPHI|nr:GH92 family glycosyl hydrolase [Mucilaginibacter sabulilitoris]WPU94750.1 GH92 family glycosyl hydrolase [Mucilaginibacter sabulilitoris]